MCGISGICLLQGHNLETNEAKDLTSKLLAYSSNRGGDATGVAVVRSDKAIVFKHHLPGKRFIKTDYYNDMMNRSLKFHNNFDKTMIILGHNRLETKGSYLNRHNNHPIIANRVVGIHNGCINNDDDLFKSNKNNFNRKAQVDSEIIFRLFDHYIQEGSEKRPGASDNSINAIKKTTDCLSGSFACAAVNLRSPWMLWLFRGWGQSAVMHYPKRGITVFASEEHIINNAVRDMDLGAALKISYNQNEGMGINIIQKYKTKFKLQRVNIQNSNTKTGNGSGYLSAL